MEWCATAVSSTGITGSIFMEASSKTLSLVNCEVPVIGHPNYVQIMSRK